LGMPPGVDVCTADKGLTGMFAINIYEKRL